MRSPPSSPHVSSLPHSNLKATSGGAGRDKGDPHPPASTSPSSRSLLTSISQFLPTRCLTGGGEARRAALRGGGRAGAWGAPPAPSESSHLISSRVSPHAHAHTHTHTRLSQPRSPPSCGKTAAGPDPTPCQSFSLTAREGGRKDGGRAALRPFNPSLAESAGVQPGDPPLLPP